MRYLTIILLAATACGQPTEGSYVDVASEMDRYVSDANAAGVVTVVVKDGDVVHQHATGFRDMELGDSLNVSDMFRIASQTKAVTSVAAMMLVEEGKLRLDDALSDFIPAFADTRVAEETDSGYDLVPMKRPITIRHLMTHTSGLSYGWGPAQAAFDSAGILGWYLADKTEPIQEVARKLAGLPLTSQPGEEFVYGWSTDVLGAVVEIASGESLDQFFRDNIFAPLKMEDTHFFIPDSKADRLVTVYGLVDRQLLRMPDGSEMQSQGEYLHGPRTCFSGGAGLVSTAQDYTRFQLMLLNGGMLDGNRILSSESVTKMTTDQLGDLFDGAEDAFGLGFRIEGEKSNGPEPPGTFSWGGAYHSHYWIDPTNNLAGIILTQLTPATGSDIRERFKQLVYEVVER